MTNLRERVAEAIHDCGTHALTWQATVNMDVNRNHAHQTRLQADAAIEAVFEMLLSYEAVGAAIRTRSDRRTTMIDDYDYKSLEAKYDDMDAAKLNAMTADERGEYYVSLYQYFARMLFIVHEVDPAISEKEEWSYPNLPQAEYWALSALGHAFHGVVDGLAGLVSMASGEEHGG